MIRIKYLKNAFQQLSELDGTKLGRTNRIVHRIGTGDAEPVKQRQHSMSPNMLQHLHKELDKMLESWSRPLLLVKKPNGYVFVLMADD